MKGEISFQSVKTLFKLDLRSRFGTTRRRGIKYRLLQAANILFFLGVYAILLAAMYFLAKIFVEKSGLRLEFLVIVSMATIVIATAVSTSTVIKNLYQNGDNELLLRFPVSGKEILLSKSIYCFLHNLIVCVLMMFPLYVMFGVVTHAPYYDYFAYFAVTLVASLLPFAIANIIAVPVMKLMNAVKNQFVLVLIFTIILLCAAFAAYLLSLERVLVYMRDSNQNIFSGGMIERYRAFASGAYPFRWYAELINGRRYGELTSGGLALRFLYIALMTAAFSVAAYFITEKQYYRTILYGIETQKATVSRKSKDVMRPQWVALLNREFYLILRSFNYSFQYLAMACAAPVMVFFCNRLAAALGTASIGQQIMPGLTLMVIIIFITITVSFASTCISREGMCFYHTKVIPVSYTKQVAVKFAMYAVVATISVALCCVVSGAYYTSEAGGHLLTAVDMVAIFFIAEMIVVGLTSLCILVDVKSPTFNVSGDGELVSANKNVAIALIVGIFIAVVYGIVAMVFNFIPIVIGNTLFSINTIYIILSLVSLAFMGGCLAGLFVKLEKHYAHIVP